MAHTGFRIAGAACADGERGPDLAPDGDGPVPHGGGQPDGGGAATLLEPGRTATLRQLLPVRGVGTEKLLEYLPLISLLSSAQIRGALVGRYERLIADALSSGGSAFPSLRLLGSLGGFVDGHLFIAPYVGIHAYFGREIQKTRTLRRQVMAGRTEPVRVGVFVDNLDEIHGVATMYHNLQRLADKPGDARLQVVRCGAGPEGGTVGLNPMAVLPMPLQEGRTLGVPSLLDVLEHVAAARYDVLHVATPGPLGLAALMAGATLGLPLVGAYHTEFGIYAQHLSGDALVAELVEVLVREFYERCAVVAVPSASTALALQSRGYRINRFEVLRNGVDTALYGPSRRDEAHRAALGGPRTLLLYAGRVSREKGLEGLAEGYLALRRRRDDVHLVIAGDGPYRRELEAKLGERATFTGFLRGDALARTFASCDVFVFPSATDTLGRAVAEAQASGLPAVVFGMGGPRECIRPGISGFVVDPGDIPGFLARVEHLLDDPALRAEMGRAGRAFAQTLSWDSVLDDLTALYREVVDGRAAAPDPIPATDPELGAAQAPRETAKAPAA
jgi:glycosyltransferase involved in cell wall biosynthesis